MEVIVTIVSKLVYNLLKGLIIYIYRGYSPVTKYHGHPSNISLLLLKDVCSLSPIFNRLVFIWICNHDKRQIPAKRCLFGVHSMFLLTLLEMLEGGLSGSYSPNWWKKTKKHLQYIPGTECCVGDSNDFSCCQIVQTIQRIHLDVSSFRDA